MNGEWLVPRKRVLMMTVGAYPPSRGPGPLRALGFSRHLPEFGWQPVVMTFREGDLGELADASLRDRIPPHVELHEVRAWEYVLRACWPRRAGRSRGAGTTPTAADAACLPDSPATVDGEASSTSLSPASARGLFVSLFGPEVYPLSLVPVLHRAKRLARACHAIFSTSPPFNNHLIARRVQRATGLPWIADFRDPYACGVWHLRASSAGQARAARREQSVVMSADTVVVVTEDMRDLYVRAFPALPPDRLQVITNGYDEDLSRMADEIHRSLTPDPNAPLTLIHAGRFYADDALDGLCRAVRSLLSSGRCAPSDIRLEFLGALTPSQSVLLKKYDLLALAAPPRRVPQREAFERMCRADVLLVEAGANIAHYAIRAKLFEYMAARRPVLALAEAGQTADIVIKTGIGMCLLPSDTAGLATFIADRVRDKRNGRPWINARRLAEEFDRRALTRRLATLLDAGRATRST